MEIFCLSHQPTEHASHSRATQGAARFLCWRKSARRVSLYRNHDSWMNYYDVADTLGISYWSVRYRVKRHHLLTQKMGRLRYVKLRDVRAVGRKR